MEDERIIELLFARDEQAIEEIRQKYGALCRQVARFVLNSPEDGEECLNDAWLQIWNAVPPARPENLRAFLCRIVRCRALDMVRYDTRKKRCAPGFEQAESEMEGILSEAGFENDLVDELAFSQTIDCWLEELDPRDRVIFVLRYWFFEPVASIAERMHLPAGTVKRILHQCRKDLAKKLKKEGLLP